MDTNAWLILATAWWLLFWTAIGLCIGSFLNAVIYRLPRNRSLRSPLWSFCPHCKGPIHWFDNLPILSFVLLRGRCRSCGAFIPTRYVVVEAAMALIVLMLLDAMFIGRVRAGLSLSQFGITDRLWYDWPILTAHIILFACLLAMSAIDLEHYWVDIRFTNFATLVGFACHTIWTPKHSLQWIRPMDSTAVVSLFALAGLAAVWIWQVCRPAADPETSDDPESVSPDPFISTAAESRQSEGKTFLPRSRAAGWVVAFLLLATFIALLLDESGTADLRHTGRALLPLLVFCCLIVVESTIPRPSDALIADAIEEERPYARRMVLSELATMIPVILAGAIGWWLMAGSGELPDRIAGALHSGSDGSWRPLLGFATAASGFLIGGALGWTIRIGFTLLFGKEALGTGDIHLMAAAGCVAGWPIVVLGFFLTCFLAMLGWLLTLPFKRTRALPLGPWLSVSFLFLVIFYDQVVEWSLIERTVMLVRMFILGHADAGVTG